MVMIIKEQLKLSLNISKHQSKNNKSIINHYLK